MTKPAKAPKPVKAWTCVNPVDGKLIPRLTYDTREDAKYGWKGSVERVEIRVLGGKK